MVGGRDAGTNSVFLQRVDADFVVLLVVVLDVVYVVVV